jgi:hypothetical protein
MGDETDAKMKLLMREMLVTLAEPMMAPLEEIFGERLDPLTWMISFTTSAIMDGDSDPLRVFTENPDMVEFLKGTADIIKQRQKETE